MSEFRYILKHKNCNVAVIELDEEAVNVRRVEPIRPEAGPFLVNHTNWICRGIFDATWEDVNLYENYQHGIYDGEI